MREALGVQARLREANMSLSEYDEQGRCISTEIVVVICSPSPGGAVDPSTRREYKLFCTACQSRRFYEGEDQEELYCVGCGKISGMEERDEGDLC